MLPGGRGQQAAAGGGRGRGVERGKEGKEGEQGKEGAEAVGGKGEKKGKEGERGKRERGAGEEEHDSLPGELG